jgi:hypothetical protein
MRVEELQVAGAVRIHERGQHLALEQARQHVDMHEEVIARRDPSRAVEREPSARCDHMHVRMMGERRSPCVEHGRDADPRPEALGVGRDGERRLGRRLVSGLDREWLERVKGIEPSYSAWKGFGG